VTRKKAKQVVHISKDAEYAGNDASVTASVGVFSTRMLQSKVIKGFTIQLTHLKPRVCFSRSPATDRQHSVSLHSAASQGLPRCRPERISEDAP